MDGLLAPDEGAAVLIREGGGAAVVVCEHASNRLPKALGDLGLSAKDLTRHIAWDPGAAEIAAGIASRLDGTLVLQRFSRLAIDCNREPSLSDAIATLSEDTPIPGNADLSPEARGQRIEGIWRPFHDALAGLLDRRRDQRLPTMLITVHSFTPVYRGVARPWHVGIISTEERSFAGAVLAALRREAGLVVGDNQPYSAKDHVDYTIRRHGLERGLPHVMIEVRNDLAASADGQQEWADRLARAIAAFNAANRAA